MKIKWKYCECGCHGSDAVVGGFHFWHYWDIETDPKTFKTRYGKYYLRLGGQMMFGEPLGEFDTLHQVNSFIKGYISGLKTRKQ